ncbi:MAG: hypothetical protein HXL02_03370, partial [Candidatus Nanosynbacter sp.]|nr:hypothetical protein [Candidatus Nanosynbacter sp.]
ASSSKDALPYYGFALVGEVMTVQSPPIWSLDEGNIVEQFTGLKDINGAEIFEGDIVKYGDNVGEVFYDSECACFNVSGFYNGSQDYPTMAFNEHAVMEVIGNIHENPELLEKK